MATPSLDELSRGDSGFFDRTVVYVLEHTDAGAVGVVLNRLDARIDDVIEALGSSVLEQWHPHLAPPAALFVGGPVGEDALIGLAEGQGRGEKTWGAITPTLGTVDLSLTPDEATISLVRLRIFRGYAGWAGGQLEAELAAGVWMVFDAIDEDLFTDEPDALWRAVVRRQGGRLRWIADAPDDITAN